MPTRRLFMVDERPFARRTLRSETACGYIWPSRNRKDLVDISIPKSLHRNAYLYLLNGIQNSSFNFFRNNFLFSKTFFYELFSDLFFWSPLSRYFTLITRTLKCYIETREDKNLKNIVIYQIFLCIRILLRNPLRL